MIGRGERDVVGGAEGGAAEGVEWEKDAAAAGVGGGDWKGAAVDTEGGGGEGGVWRAEEVG